MAKQGDSSMAANYILTPKQIAVLRALGEGIVELSTAEIAVFARLLPNQVISALKALEQLGLVNSWFPITGRGGEPLFVLTSEGQTVLRGLAQFGGIPSAGTVVQLPGPPSFPGWLGGRQSVSRVEIALDESDR
jgi:DNA-binding CsgD family transcriptional regulator